MWYFLIFIFALFWACSPNEQPQNLLSKTQMAEIIVDLAIYDHSHNINPDSDLETTTKFILKKHRITPTAFRESYAYYLYNPDNMDDIYNEAKQIIQSKDPDLAKKLNQMNPLDQESLQK